MRHKTVSVRDLSYCRSMLSTQAPGFISLFIIFLLLLIAAALCWMWWGRIDIIVRTRGIVRPQKTISVVCSPRSGLLEKINYFSGQQVEPGDELFKVNTGNLIEEKKYLEARIKKIKKEHKNLLLFKKSIIGEENLFVGNEIQNNTGYEKRFLVYQNQKKKLYIKYQKADHDYHQEKLLSEAATTERRLQELKLERDLRELERTNFKRQKLAELKDQINRKTKELAEYRHRKKEVRDEIKLSTVQAPISGTVNIIQDFNRGEYITAGTETVKIIPREKSAYKIELVVNNEDIGKIEEGQKVRYRFEALPHREYGVSEGQIMSVGDDIAGRTALYEPGKKQTELSYRAVADVEEIALTNKRGDRQEIKTGMTAEGRIIVDRRRILLLVLEKLDFIS